jgi:hypothetical protein
LIAMMFIKDMYATETFKQIRNKKNIVNTQMCMYQC